MNKHILLASALLISSLLGVSAQGTATTTATAPANNQSSPTQTPNAPQGTSTSKAILLAQIDLYNATIKKTGLVNYTFSFTLKSFDLINQEAYYRALVKDKDGKVVFVQSFPTKVTIGAQESKPVSDVLIVPLDLKGTYSVFVQVTNAKGLPLATANAGTIEPVGAKSVMSIKGCVITGSTTKMITESVEGICTLEGKVTPSTMLYTTVYYGTMAAPSTQVKSRITANKGTFSIPPRTEPGVYQTVSQLYDEGTPMSSPEFGSFTVEGQSAKIISIKTDKGVYKKDEVAKIAVALKTYNVRAGDIFVSAKIVDQDTTICGVVPSSVITNNGAFELSVTMTRKCSLPSVTVTITDKAEKVLDTYTSVVVSTGEKKSESTLSSLTKGSLGYIGGFAVLIILLVLGYYVVRRMRNKENVTV